MIAHIGFMLYLAFANGFATEVDLVFPDEASCVYVGELFVNNPGWAEQVVKYECHKTQEV